MKIGPIDPKPIATTTADRKNTPAPFTAAPEPSTKVALSSSADRLASAGTDPSFDGAKVERIAQAIRDGQFKVNPEAIADKLIINAAELLGRKPS